MRKEQIKTTSTKDKSCPDIIPMRESCEYHLVKEVRLMSHHLDKVGQVDATITLEVTCIETIIGCFTSPCIRKMSSTC